MMGLDLSGAKLVGCIWCLPTSTTPTTSPQTTTTMTTKADGASLKIKVTL